jgi:hypothetical protein
MTAAFDRAALLDAFDLRRACGLRPPENQTP